MISWATKIDPIADNIDSVSSTCKVCSAEGKARYMVEQNYFLLYGLPIFPTERRVYKICPSCTFKAKLKQGNSRVLDDYSTLKLTEIHALYPKKMKFKYFWGNLIFLLIFGMIAWFILEFAVK